MGCGVDTESGYSRCPTDNGVGIIASYLNARLVLKSLHYAAAGKIPETFCGVSGGKPLPTVVYLGIPLTFSLVDGSRCNRFGGGMVIFKVLVSERHVSSIPN